MKRFFNRKNMLSFSLVLALATGFALGLLVNGSRVTHAASLPFRTFDDYANFVRAHHKAPFDLDAQLAMPAGSAQALKRQASRSGVQASGTATSNVRVTRDRNPWPKAEIGAAVNPADGNNYVVMSNDFRENFDHQFFHVSTNGGQSWTDDSMVGGNDPFTGFVPLTFQSDPGVAFDASGNLVLSTVTLNQIFDFTNGYQNLDSQVEVAIGQRTFTSLLPTIIDTVPCNGTFSAFNCPGTLDKPLVTIDNVKGSPNNGAIYIYYTYFCNGAADGGPCTDGNATIPAGSSAILVSSAPGAGGQFSPPTLVSGSFTQEQFSDLVVDSHGTPHIFFDDFTSFTDINMYESTLTHGTWVVNPKPVATFNFSGLGNTNWGFRSNGAVAPGCGIWVDTAYCAFSATQIGTGTAANTPSVFLTTVNTLTGSSHITQVNNDRFLGNKDHFFAWATATAKGIYVGWYDDRNDPFSTKVDYFVGKSTNGGKTFPTQKAVNSVSFNPCTGFPGCGFFGDYTQLVSGPDNVVHAAWSDTRDTVSMQIWSQAVTW